MLKYLGPATKHKLPLFYSATLPFSVHKKLARNIAFVLTMTCNLRLLAG
jgi:hypothetical protein